MYAANLSWGGAIALGAGDFQPGYLWRPSPCHNGSHAVHGFLVGEKKPGLEKSRPYECGVIPTGAARLRYPVPFYLVAIFFLIFDVEGAYIFTWAVTYEDLGWPGWLQMSFFIMVLLIGLLYIWKKGGLDWGPAYQTK